MENETISVIGMGKLGLCMAACLAHKGYNVIGVDVNQSIIQAINNGRAPLYEPGLSELMAGLQGNFVATNDYKYAVDNSKIIFIFVATPSEGDGSLSTKYVEDASKEIAANIKHKDDFSLIVLRSTVLCGVTDSVVKPMLEKVSGKKCGIDFGLCYNPEILALGSVIHDFMNPDVVVIGESDSQSGELLSEVYQTTCENNPPIIRTTFYNAELAKISLNVFLTMKISFANTIAEICERVPGGETDVISKIVGLDSRIGRKFLNGGLAYGGPCFPRDNKAFIFFAQKIGFEVKLSEATEEVNKHQNERIVELIKQKIGKVQGKSIAILGLTYKPNTNVIEESAAIKIASALLQERANLSVYDPAGMENARKVLDQPNIKYASSVEECLIDTELCILATPWDEFKSLTPEDFITNMKQPVLLDCWRIFRRSEFIEKLRYFAVGINISK